MPTFNTPMLTDFGRDLLGRVNAGKTKVTYTKTIFSSMDNSDKTDDDIKKMKAITPAEITSTPSTNYEDGNTVEVRAIGTNRGLTNSVAINTYATYAKDDNNNEAPFAIAVSQSPDYMPADSGQAITNLTFSILFTVQDTKNINFNDPHNETPTYQDIQDMRNSINGIQGQLSDTLKPYDNRITDNRNDINNLKNNTYTKQDTDNSIKTAMNQANSHSDDHYNDLSNKNDILSSNLKSTTNTTNDLADKYNRSYYDAPNLSNTTNTDYSGYGWGKILDFPVEAGKKYWISAYSNENDNWDLETVYDNSQSKMTNTGFFSRSFIADSTKNMPIVPYNDSGNGGNLTKICITQSDNYVPYEVAQRNKLWNDRITNKTDILNKKVDDNYNSINDKITNSINTSINQANQTSQQLSKDKVTDNHDGTMQINGSKIAVHQDLKPCDLNDVVQTGTFYSTGMMYNYNHAPEGQNAGFTLIVKVSSSGSDIYQKIISPSLTRPYYRQKGWNTWQGWQKEATQDDIASIKANAWRELATDGADGFILCKVNWDNNTAQLYGGIQRHSKDNNNPLIYASNDFKFKDSGTGMYRPFMSGGSISVTNDGNLIWNNAEALHNNGLLLFSGSTTINYIEPSGAFGTKYTHGYDAITCSIVPK